MATGVVKKVIRTRYTSDLQVGGGLDVNGNGQLVVDKTVVQQGLKLDVNPSNKRIELKDASGMVLDFVQLESVTNLDGSTVRGWIDFSAA